LRTQWLVSSLAYSLSPEIQHPHPIHEVADVIQNACHLAAEAGHTIKRIAVCGDSAGGFLIAAAMHHLALNNLPLPDAAAFLYPIADVSMQYDSYKTFASGYQLTAERMQWYWGQYLGREISSPAERADPYLSPLNSPLLHKFPRSMVATVEFDPLRDEGLELAQRLSAAGVPVELIEIPGQIHGFLRFRRALTDPEWGPDAVMERIGGFLNSTNG
ncbi:MAG TPA: alpha/beta hydrolase, partial [Edaphobacter sp.]|nr:alpha/beta hydrolase [Edaphobacter sp.]